MKFRDLDLADKFICPNRPCILIKTSTVTSEFGNAGAARRVVDGKPVEGFGEIIKDEQEVVRIDQGAFYGLKETQCKQLLQYQAARIELLEKQLHQIFSVILAQ
jgi:hypothetical protein